MVNESAELRLAKHVAQVQYDDLPLHTIERAKTFIADTLSVGIAGTAVPEATQLLQTLRSSDTGGPISVWGTDDLMSAPNAIMANAFNVHCQEYDCLHEGAVVHAMATLLPVLMAQAQTGPTINGKELITAVVAGADVSSTLGLAANQTMRFFRPATAGGFGAVAGLAKLRNMTPEEIVAAWGFQLAQSSGTMQGHREGRPVLPLQISFNARAAWQSCELAQSGLQSLDNPISGHWGYLAMFEQDYLLDPLLDALGTNWRIDEFSHKPFPSGRATHAGVQGLLELIEAHQLRAESIAEVVVDGPPLVNQLVNRAPVPNPSPNYARLCMPFVLAKIMQHGRLEPGHYFGQALTDPAAFALSQKVRMQVDQNPDPNSFTPVTITVKLTNGQMLQTTVTNMLASPQHPLTEKQCEEKFMQCCLLAVRQPPNRAEHWLSLWARLRELENINDIRNVLN